LEKLQTTCQTTNDGLNRKERSLYYLEEWEEYQKLTKLTGVLRQKTESDLYIRVKYDVILSWDDLGGDYFCWRYGNRGWYRLLSEILLFIGFAVMYIVFEIREQKNS